MGEKGGVCALVSGTPPRGTTSTLTRQRSLLGLHAGDLEQASIRGHGIAGLRHDDQVRPCTPSSGRHAHITNHIHGCGLVHAPAGRGCLRPPPPAHQFAPARSGSVLRRHRATRRCRRCGLQVQSHLRTVANHHGFGRQHVVQGIRGGLRAMSGVSRERGLCARARVQHCRLTSALPSCTTPMATFSTTTSRMRPRSYHFWKMPEMMVEASRM